MVSKIWDYVSSKGLEDLIYKLIALVAFLSVLESSRSNKLPSAVISEWSYTVFGSGTIVDSIFSWVHRVAGPYLFCLGMVLVVIATLVSAYRGVGYRLGSDRTGATIIIGGFLCSESTGGGRPLAVIMEMPIVGILFSIVPRLKNRMVSDYSLSVYKDQERDPLFEVLATVLLVPVLVISWMMGSSTGRKGEPKGSRFDPIYFKISDD